MDWMMFNKIVFTVNQLETHPYVIQVSLKLFCDGLCRGVVVIPKSVREERMASISIFLILKLRLPIGKLSKPLHAYFYYIYATSYCFINEVMW